MHYTHKIASAAIIALCASNTATAQSKVKTNIEHITVFLSGAEIEGAAKINLPQGETEILFTNIAGNIVQQSISVGVTNGVIVQSATAQNNYLETSNLSPKGQMLKDSIALLTQQNETFSDKKTVLAEQLAVIKENRKVAGENNGLSVIELQKMLDLISTKMNGLLADGHTLDRQMKTTAERIRLLTQQLSEEQRKDFQPGGQLLVKFFATTATAASVNINYVTPNASWAPSYDLRVDKINSPVKLVFKANITQNSGVKWDNVKLSLSTGNPNEGAEAPTMNPWYLAFYQPQPVYKKATAYESIERAPMRNLEDMTSLSPSVQDAPEGGSLRVGGAKSLGKYVQIDNSGINTTFDISLNYTIPSDGQEHLVAVKDYELPATYRYYVAPKLDKDAFLQARVTNWEDLNLMPAPTNIFYENAYVGQGYIDMRNVKDTLNLSLGRDKKIIVRRENDKNYRSVKTIGTNIRKSYGYTIEVRNTKKENIDLVVLEQFPISNDKDISIEDKEANGALINEETGAVQWPLTLKPGELKTLKLSYAIKYPKDKTINL